MGFLFCSLRKWDCTFGTKDISENITRCNLRSHGRFSQARSHIINDTFAKTGTNIVAKDVPSRIVDMNMFVTNVHIIQQPVRLIIRPYFARIVPVNN